MKKIILMILVSGFTLVACDEIEWDLPRDNPHDQYAEQEKEEALPELAFSRYRVWEDENLDGAINPGEDVSLLVYLINIGDARANNVSATFSTESPYVTAFSPKEPIKYTTTWNSSFYFIDPQEEGSPPYSDWYLNVSVADTTPGNTQIPFEVDIKDEEGRTWTDTFFVSVSVIEANIVFSHYEIWQEENNNSTINPGEAVALKVYLTNSGDSRALDLQASVSSFSGNITNLKPQGYVQYATAYNSSFYFLDPGDQGVPAYSAKYLSFEVSESLQSGTDIPFQITIRDKFGNQWEDEFNVLIE